MDALNPQTKLGKAVKGAVQELEQLNNLVSNVYIGLAARLVHPCVWLCYHKT